MSFNGTGTFNINTTGQPVVTGTVISSSTFNLLTADLATGLTTCITKDGQSTPTANIPMGSYKLTGLGAPTISGDALSFGNVATISTLTLTNPLGTASGGTALSSFTSGGALYATSASALTTGTLPVASGGTGAVTFTNGGVLIGNVTGAIQVTSAGTAGQVLTSNGSGVDPTFQAGGMSAPQVIATSTISTFTGTLNAFRTFPLDTLDRNEGSYATLPGSNRLSLAAGTWHIKARTCLRLPSGAVAYGLAQPRIYNVTDAAEIGPRGVNVMFGTGDYMAGNPEAEVVVVLAATKSLEFQAYLTAASSATFEVVEIGGGTTGDIYVQWVCTKI